MIIDGKVFCKGCKWNRNPLYLPNGCGHPNNIVVMDGAYDRTRRPLDYSSANGHNDCALHEPKRWWEFWK